MSQVVKEGPLADLGCQELGAVKAVSHGAALNRPVVLMPGRITFALREPGCKSFPPFLSPCKTKTGGEGAQRGSQYRITSLTRGELSPWAPGMAGSRLPGICHWHSSERKGALGTEWGPDWWRVSSPPASPRVATGNDVQGRLQDWAGLRHVQCFLG